MRLRQVLLGGRVRPGSVGLAFLLLAACGCARQFVHQKADVTEAERERDQEACRRDATVPRVARPLVFVGGRLVSYPFMEIDPQVYGRCMASKGYATVKN